ncbi:MAG TPA: TonB-dependent receptor, partial [Candidatus Eremiobacteraceae bacterium]
MIHPRLTLCRAAAFIASIFLLLSNAPATAGTTGALVGLVTDVNGKPLTGVAVTVSSPSQTDKTLSNVEGNFTFASLSPDSYTVTFARAGYASQQFDGVEVLADNVRSVSVKLQQEVKVLGHVTHVDVFGIVRPGATADFYAISATDQVKLAPLGGGGGLDNAYSGIAAVPGAFVPPSQTGWNQPIFLRGGDFTEIGYELDGVPLNRSFDHIPTTNLSSLGQASLTVYTGGAPANAESNGLSGYVNQVIKRGSYPGSATATFGIGAPSLYNKVNLEAGGGTADRRFSYYVGTSIVNQDFRYRDQSNGASFSTEFGNPFDLQFAALGPDFNQLGQPGCGLPNGSNFAGCYANRAFFRALPAGPGGFILGPYQMGRNSNIADRENIANFHVGIPRANGRMDDFQLLYDTSELYTNTYSSYLDWGGAAFWQGVDGQAFGLKAGSPPYPTFVPGFAYIGALGQPVTGAPGGPINGVIPYLYPGTSLANLAGAIPLDQRDASSNGQSILKAQFQHNFSSDAYIRGYAYSAYSNWFVSSPNGLSQLFIANSADRELSTHTTGFTVNMAGEING